MRSPVGQIGRATGPVDTSGRNMSLSTLMRQAWGDEDLRRRLSFVGLVFAIYALCIHVQVPIPGVDPTALQAMLQNNAFLQLLNQFGGGAFKRISILALGLGPYITASIIMQVLTYANPAWKKELQEGGEYARRQQNRRTRFLTLFLCIVQGIAIYNQMAMQFNDPAAKTVFAYIMAVSCWTAGSMLMLYLGEQISERGIGNGVSILIFAGIIIAFPGLIQTAAADLGKTYELWQLGIVIALFLATTWFIVMFTSAQRRIPIQHMRRNYGTKTLGGQTSYLPINVNMAGVMPVIFAVSLTALPSQVAALFPPNTQAHQVLIQIAQATYPDFTKPQGYIGAVLYMALIFAFTFFWNALIYNVEDISNNLKRAGSYIPGIRPGRQTKDFLNGVITRVTVVGAFFLAIVALTQYLFPLIARIQSLALVGGTSLLIMVAVALETVRQVEANLLTKQYGGS